MENTSKFDFEKQVPVNEEIKGIPTSYEVKAVGKGSNSNLSAILKYMVIPKDLKPDSAIPNYTFISRSVPIPQISGRWDVVHLIDLDPKELMPHYASDDPFQPSNLGLTSHLLYDFVQEMALRRHNSVFVRLNEGLLADNNGILPWAGFYRKDERAIMKNNTLPNVDPNLGKYNPELGRDGSYQ